MKSLFHAPDRAALLERLRLLQPDSPRQWGTMDPAQMLRHCALALETATGDRPMKQKLLGKLLTPFIRSLVLGERPFSQDAPTDPSFRVRGSRDFQIEREALMALVAKFVDRGEAEAARQTHAFFGRLSGAEWGLLMHKHLDHHFRQFGG